MKRIKAFSILELVVAMAITSFIVLAGYVAFSTFMARFHVFQSAANNKVDLAQLNSVLQADIAQNTSVRISADNILTLESEDSLVVYKFVSDFITREKDGYTDTFFLKVTRVTTAAEELNPIYIRQITMALESGGQATTIDIVKEYDPFFLINYSSK